MASRIDVFTGLGLNCDQPGLITPDQLDQIERNADIILDSVGCRIEDEQTIEVLASVEDTKVKADKVFVNGEVLRNIIRQHTPGSFIQHARNAKRNILIGGQEPIFIPTYGTPNVSHDHQPGRLGRISDYQELVCLSQQFNSIKNTGLMNCVVHDVPPAMVPHKMTLAHLSLSDKPFMGSIASSEAVQDVHDMVSMVVGADAFKQNCYLVHFINSTPALTYQKNPLQCLRQAALNGQACLVASYMMMGASAPVTVMGALAQGYAEIMIGLALTQLYKPGTPVIAGIYGMPFSMRSMIPVYGDPISQLMQSGGIQLAHRLGLPSRGDGQLTSSKIYDDQSRYEGAMALASAINLKADFILHSAGWQENGRCLNIEKFKQEAQLLDDLFFMDQPFCDMMPLEDKLLHELDHFITSKNPNLQQKDQG